MVVQMHYNFYVEKARQSRKHYHENCFGNYEQKMKAEGQLDVRLLKCERPQSHMMTEKRKIKKGRKLKL
jgi:hypothetical protein